MKKWSPFSFDFEDNFRLKKAFTSNVIKRRDLWINGLYHELFEKENSIYDKLLCDLIYKLINNDSKEKITNYKQFFDHPFFSQYKILI